MTVHTAAVALLLLLAGPALAQPPCPAGSTCGGLGAVIGAAPPLPAPAQATDAVPVVRAGHTYSASPAAIGPQVANTAALRAASTATYPLGVTRLTDGAAGAPPLFFAPAPGGACSADDVGRCVAAAGGGYWLAQFSGPADVREWGAPTTGDATAAVQAAVTAVGSYHGVLSFATQVFSVSSAIHVASGLTVDCGNPSTPNVGATVGYGGLSVTTPNIDAISLDVGSDGTQIRNCWLNMDKGAVNTSGSALDMPGTPAQVLIDNLQTTNTCIGINLSGNNDWVTRSFILNTQGGLGCSGIVVGHYASPEPTVGGGVLTTTIAAAHPLTTQPTSAATPSGSTLTFASVPAAVFVGEVVFDETTPASLGWAPITYVSAIGSTTVTLSSPVSGTVGSGDVIGFLPIAEYGIKVEGGGGEYFADNDVLYSIYGTAYIPSTSTHAISWGFTSNSVLGDTTFGQALLVDTLTSADRVQGLQFTGSWGADTALSAITGGPVSEGTLVSILNDGGGTVTGVSLDGGRFLGGWASTVNVAGTVTNTSITDSKLCDIGFGAPNTVTAAGLRLDSGLTSILVSNNWITPNCTNVNSSSAIQYGIAFGGSNYGLTVVGNYLALNSGGAFQGQPQWSGAAPNQDIVVSGNVGTPYGQNTAAAATITLTDAGVGTLFVISGATTITEIDNCWPGRSLVIVPSVSTTFGTGGNIGSALTTSAAVRAEAIQNGTACVWELFQ